MKFALFLGCHIPAHLKQYESSARAVLKKVDVELVDIKAFNCCGYPIRNMDHKAFVFASARNLALAGKKNLNIISLCKCCYGSLKKADHLIKENASLRTEIDRNLHKEGLKYDGDVEIKHFLSVLFHDVGIEALKKKITKSFSNLMMATHYGCHALRPSNIVQFDDPVAPSIFDKLVEVTGAVSVDWSMKSDCCGAPLWGINDDLSMNLTAKKLADAKQAGADYLCSACPYCHQQFDTVQRMMVSQNGNDPLASVLYPQMLGLAMGIEEDELGIRMNQIDISGITSYLSQE